MSRDAERKMDVEKSVAGEASDVYFSRRSKDAELIHSLSDDVGRRSRCLNVHANSSNVKTIEKYHALSTISLRLCLCVMSFSRIHRS
ncbi:uncharacterized protein Bfra_000514 [Botrytis fragariae]|uniref:Uncharacterized protein n=1 Tax=Botrytis fragariae TaxID=1964551 RepID=A0A8H6B2M5_9HELO|nr:uncharacterized protein Bfra_000514 [Botrytis fragariae]KAF5878348.1 hypothetical protein Bfra_000514 [Botrytis fragariae]